ncbi:hypothetical protein [Streptomyces sp. NPDC006552]
MVLTPSQVMRTARDDHCETWQASFFLGGALVWRPDATWRTDEQRL